MKLARLALLFAALAIGVFAQAPAVQDHEDNQSWNDVQLTVPVNEHFDFSTRLTLRIGKNISQLSDERFSVGFIWKPTKALSITPFYTFVNTRNALGRYRLENRLNLAAAYRFPFKRIGLTHRSTIERRLRRPIDSWRYRAQFMVDKDIPAHIIPKAKWFISDEVFYDFLLDRFSRNRFTIGITKTLNKHLGLDVYYMRQNDGISRPGDLNIIGTAWKIRT